MAVVTATRPFNPEEVSRILLHLQEPAVFLNMTSDWPVLQWTAEHLSSCLGDELIRFRLGKKQESDTPLFETQCSYVQAKVMEFLCWAHGQSDVGPFSNFPHQEYWAYADYKYISQLFQNQPSMFEDVKWSDFGFDGRNGRDSTLWIGTQGANTPCHLDTYGCNLVLQVQGRKQWHLFPPEDTSNLYPTRIPYEESSVFSSVDVLRPDLKKFPAFRAARAHTVLLEPGQVLYVPRHWWHYVESLDPVTVSVNTWVELEEDDIARVSEAVTKTVVWALKTAKSEDNTDAWLNPTEEENVSHDDNLQYLNLAASVCARRQRDLPLSSDANSLKGNSSEHKKNRDSVRNTVAFSVPFGPHLVPVGCRQEGTQRRCESNSSGDRAWTSEETSREKFESEDRPKTFDGSSAGAPRNSRISTNDLLACLLHPDVIAQVTELLMKRRRDRL